MIDYEEDTWCWVISLLLTGAGGCRIRALCFALPSATIAVLLMLLDDIEQTSTVREDTGIHLVTASQIWSACFTALVFLLGFRTKLAYSRFWEGTGLLHRMRGEWFDTVSNCVTFSIKAKTSMPLQVMTFRHALVRLMSICHGVALEEIAGESIVVQKIDAKGLDWHTIEYLDNCHECYGFNRVEALLHLTQSLVTTAFRDGILDIPPPILSRVFQTISRGLVNLLNAKKITNTKFPFPFAQLLSMLVFFMMLLTPFIISSLVTDPKMMGQQKASPKVMAFIFTIIPTYSLAILNNIAMELEDPFGEDKNDLPMSLFQEEMNSCLLMLLHPSTDLHASLCPEAILEFDEIARMLIDDLDPRMVAMQSSISSANMQELKTNQELAELLVIQSCLSHGNNSDAGSMQSGQTPYQSQREPNYSSQSPMDAAPSFSDFTSAAVRVGQSLCGLGFDVNSDLAPSMRALLCAQAEAESGIIHDIDSEEFVAKLGAEITELLRDLLDKSNLAALLDISPESTKQD